MKKWYGYLVALELDESLQIPAKALARVLEVNLNDDINEPPTVEVEAMGELDVYNEDGTKQEETDVN